MIYDPSASTDTLYFYNTTTKKTLHIERQFIVSSNEKPPAKEDMAKEYKNFIDLASPIIKIQQPMTLGKEVTEGQQV